MVRVDRPRRDSRNVGAMGKKDSGVASVVALAANGEVKKKKKKKKKVKDADKAAAASVAKVGGSNWAALSTVSTREGAINFSRIPTAPPGGLPRSAEGSTLAKFTPQLLSDLNIVPSEIRRKSARARTQRRSASARSARRRRRRASAQASLAPPMRTRQSRRSRCPRAGTRL